MYRFLTLILNTVAATGQECLGAIVAWLGFHIYYLSASRSITATRTDIAQPSGLRSLCWAFSAHGTKDSHHQRAGSLRSSMVGHFAVLTSGVTQHWLCNARRRMEVTLQYNGKQGLLTSSLAFLQHHKDRIVLLTTSRSTEAEIGKYLPPEHMPPHVRKVPSQ